MAGAEAAYPWEITVEILSRVAVKSLMRFKCVSKSFNDLISRDSWFRKKHFDQSNLTRVLFCGNDVCYKTGIASCSLDIFNDVGGIDMTHVKIPTSKGDRWQDIRIYSWNNGLFCFVDNSGSVFVWNPSTQESKCILYDSPIYDWLSAACELIYDPVNDEYKVFLRISRMSGFSFFYSKIGIWREIFLDIPDIRGKNGSFKLVNGGFNLLNGASHWIARTRKFDDPLVILSIAIHDEKCKKLALPSNLKLIRESGGGFGLKVLGGKLCLHCCSLNIEDTGSRDLWNDEDTGSRDLWNLWNDEDTGSWDLWVMEEYGVAKSWNKKISIPVKPPLAVRIWRPLYLFDDGNKILLSARTGRIGQRQKRVFIYNLQEQKFEQGNIPYYTEFAYVWKETLTSPHPNRGNR